jgi:hypothetical protein
MIPTCATYLGGSNFEDTFAVAADAFGNVYLSGLTGSADFPVTPRAAQPIFGGNADAYVAKFNPRLTGPASLLYPGKRAGDKYPTTKALLIILLYFETFVLLPRWNRQMRQSGEAGTVLGPR